ncbi:FG-GAP-like repeat-containing protein [Lacibacterium aquatile]|uniref:FG-GAP-like repeat-containing protein n=1 Tax=Lacibacterium aquatile TaxID=1168082 RepID=A0ABW5DQN9_9PROT
MVLPSKLNVGQSGSASYSLPISVVPGTSGMEPKLELTYDSQSGNGLLGVGWGISGLSAITRCPRTRAQDGVNGGVSYDAGDRFCLDGQRLNLISGMYGEDNSEYRTEREEFSKIVATAIVNVQLPPPAAPINWPYIGPISFKVQTKAGVTMEFGTTADSAVQTANGSFRVWALSKVTDAKGNYFTISYEKSADNSEYRPSKILYTGNAGAGLAPSAAVVFDYEPDTRPDVVPMYQAGSLVKITKRMTAIRVLDTVVGDPPAGSLVRKYRFSYEVSPSTKRSRLTSIKLCTAKGGQEICLPETNFTWSDWRKKATVIANVVGDETFSYPSRWSEAWGSASPSDNSEGEGGYTTTATRQRNLVDMDGDGKADILGFICGGAYWSKAQPDNASSALRFAMPVQVVNQFGDCAVGGNWNDDNVTPRSFADTDNDGVVDVLGIGTTAVYDARSTVNGWSVFRQVRSGFGATNGFPTQDETPRHFVDLNGDGILDLAAFGRLGIYVTLGNGDGTFSGGSYWSNDFGSQTSGTYSSDYTKPRFFADLDGDGLPEAIGIAATGVFAAKNTGAGFGTRIKRIDAYGIDTGFQNQSTHPRSFIDMNGDGLADFVAFSSSGLVVFLSKGDLTFAPGAVWLTGFAKDNGFSNENTHPRRFADMNGDGLPDLVTTTARGIYLALSNGTSLQNLGQVLDYFSIDPAAGGYNNQTRWPTALADVNGDGYPDIVGFNEIQTRVSTNNAGNILPDLMTSAISGTGQRWVVTYKTLSQVGAPYVKSALRLQDAMNIQAPISVVAELKALDGLAANATVLSRASYRYETLRANTQGRSLLGFEKTVSRDENTKIEQVTTLHQQFPLTGMIAKVERFYVPTVGSAGVRLGETANTYAEVSLNSGASTYVKLTKTVEKSWELTPAGTQGVQLPTVTTTYVNDTWGNATQVKVVIDQDNDGTPEFVKTTVNVYEPANTSLWRLGRLTRTTITNTTP